MTGELDLREQARPICERLAEALGETVTLDVLDGLEILPIEQATGSSSFVSVSWLGRRTPIHCTASGKAAQSTGRSSKAWVRAPIVLLGATVS